MRANSYRETAIGHPGVDHLFVVDARIYNGQLPPKLLVKNLDVLRLFVLHHVSANRTKFFRPTRDGESEPIHIEETATTCAIGWKGRYRIEAAAFVYSDQDTGRITTILGYPTDKLTQTA